MVCADALVERTLCGLHGRGIGARFASCPEEAREFLLGAIDVSEVVGVGNSQTVKATGIVQALRDRGNPILDKTSPGLRPEEIERTKREALLSDVYLSSANAISADGYLVNIDHSGNRVAAIVFGPKRVFILAGTNKIVPDLESAVRRAREVAAPLNARRSGHSPPCLRAGRCVDCASPERVCRILAIIEGQVDPNRMTVILIGADMGF